MLSRETLTIIREVIHYAAYWSNPNATMANILKEIDAELQLLSSASTDCNQHKAEEVTEAAYAHGGIKGVQYVEEKSEELKEAARQYAESRGNGVVLDKLLSTAFLAGAEWANTRPAAEKVLGEGWVIVGPKGTVISLTNASCEAHAWGAIPTAFNTPEERNFIIAEHKAAGYRAVKVKIVEVE